jgi:hypothetical protein
MIFPETVTIELLIKKKKVTMELLKWNLRSFIIATKRELWKREYLNGMCCWHCDAMLWNRRNDTSGS